MEKEALTPEGIAERNQAMLLQYFELRCAADAVAEAWRRHPDLLAISLIGSLARQPWKDVPRFSPYRQKGIKIWHECRDVDLVLWLSKTDDLKSLRRLKSKTLAQFRTLRGGGVASHQVEAVILEPGTNRHLGWLCEFNQCPKPGKIACQVPGCGDAKFLRQFEKFRWRSSSLAHDRCLPLCDQSSGLRRKAALLHLPGIDWPGGAPSVQCADMTARNVDVRGASEPLAAELRAAASWTERAAIDWVFVTWCAPVERPPAGRVSGPQHCSCRCQNRDSVHARSQLAPEPRGRRLH